MATSRVIRPAWQIHVTWRRTFRQEISQATKGQPGRREAQDTAERDSHHGIKPIERKLGPYGPGHLPPMQTAKARQPMFTPNVHYKYPPFWKP